MGAPYCGSLVNETALPQAIKETRIWVAQGPWENAPILALFLICPDIVN